MSESLPRELSLFGRRWGSPGRQGRTFHDQVPKVAEVTPTASAEAAAAFIQQQINALLEIPRGARVPAPRYGLLIGEAIDMGIDPISMQSPIDTERSSVAHVTRYNHVTGEMDVEFIPPRAVERVVLSAVRHSRTALQEALSTPLTHIIKPKPGS